MIRLAEKIGFTEIERIEKHHEVRGQRYDNITFSISKDDFFRRHIESRTV
jgi:RimJ/RimL family protein N-acetyltransferase